MAKTIVLIRLEYENTKEYCMKTKVDDEDAIEIVKVEENSDIESIWPSVENICTIEFARLLRIAGNEMKKT